MLFRFLRNPRYQCSIHLGCTFEGYGDSSMNHPLAIGAGLSSYRSASAATTTSPPRCARPGWPSSPSTPTRYPRPRATTTAAGTGHPVRGGGTVAGRGWSPRATSSSRCCGAAMAWPSREWPRLGFEEEYGDRHHLCVSSFNSCLRNNGGSLSFWRARRSSRVRPPLGWVCWQAGAGAGGRPLRRPLGVHDPHRHQHLLRRRAIRGELGPPGVGSCGMRAMNGVRDGLLSSLLGSWSEVL
jgi:hypothetical protein